MGVAVGLHFFGRFGRGTLVHGVALHRTVGVLVLLQIDAPLEVLEEAHDAGSEESGVREVPQGEFGEERDAPAGDLEGAHALSADEGDLDLHVLAVRLHGLAEFFGEGEVGGFVVARAPGVLLAVGAHLHQQIVLHPFIIVDTLACRLQ